MLARIRRLGFGLGAGATALLAYQVAKYKRYRRLLSHRLGELTGAP